MAQKHIAQGSVEKDLLGFLFGDSYHNAVAETGIGLYKTEVIRRRGPWRRPEAVEFAAQEWVDWFNHRRLHEPIGNIPPVEFEEAYYRTQEAPAMVVALR